MDNWKDNLAIRVYTTIIENRIKFKIKSGNHLAFLTSQTMKLFENTESKINKGKCGGNVPPSKITEVIL